MEIVLVIEQRVLVARITNVDKVVRDRIVSNPVISQVFSRTYIHSAVYLTRISTDNFAVEP
jgi:hypothetical protein